MIPDNREDGYGGVVILIRNGINAKKIPLIPSNPYIQATAVHTIQTGWIFASVYVKPKTPSSEFVTLLTLMFTTLNKYPMVIITGDFNSHHREWGNHFNDGKGNNLLNMINDTNFTVIHNK